MYNDVLKCSNNHCDNVISIAEIEKLHQKYLKDIKICEKSNNEFKCITKLSKKSKWAKGIKKRSKCVKQKCGKEQKKLLKSIQNKSSQKKFIKNIVKKGKKLKNKTINK